MAASWEREGRWGKAKLYNLANKCHRLIGKLPVWGFREFIFSQFGVFIKVGNSNTFEEDKRMGINSATFLLRFLSAR